MANSLKGEVAFEAGDATHILCFDFNALVELEDALDGVDPSQIGNAEKVKLKTLRTVLWAGLRPGRDGRLTATEVGQLIGELGIERTGELIKEAWDKAQLKGAANAPAHPPKPRPHAARTG